MQGRTLYSDQIYFLERGTQINISKERVIYYHDIVYQMAALSHEVKLSFVISELSFNYPNSSNGIHTFSFKMESGQLIGIMGGSGTGKSTLMNLLIGSIDPSKG